MTGAAPFDYLNGVHLIADEVPPRPVGDPGLLDPYAFLHELQGSIVLEPDENAADWVVAGRYEALYVDIEGADQEGVALDELVACHGSLSAWHGQLFTDDLALRPAVAKLSPCYGLRSRNLLLLNTLMLYGAHRGRGIGCRALQTLIRHERRGAGLVALQPMPLQASAYFTTGNRAAEWDLLELPADYAASHRCLRTLYEACGFAATADGRLMVRP